MTPTSGERPARAPRLKTLAAALIEDVAATDEGTPDAELLDWLEAALAQLPSPERAAVMTAYGYGEGSEAVAADLGLDGQDAEALSRNALQLLRGALAEAEPDERGSIHAWPDTVPAKTQRPRTDVRGLVRRPARSPHGVRWLKATFLGPGAMDRVGKL